MEFFRNKNKTIEDFGLHRVVRVTGIKVNGQEFLSQGGFRLTMDLGTNLWIGGHENLKRIVSNAATKLF